MTIFQQCLIADKKKYLFYKIVVLVTIALVVLVIFYFKFYQPKILEIKATELKVQLLTRQLKDRQEKKLKQVVAHYDETGSMPQYLHWLSGLLDKAGIQFSEISQLKLADSSLPIVKLRVKFKASASKWFAFINFLLQSNAILITDFKYQDSQAANVDLIIFMDEPMKEIDFPPINNSADNLLCSSEWYVEKEDENSIT